MSFSIEFPTMVHFKKLSHGMKDHLMQDASNEADIQRKFLTNHVQKFFNEQLEKFLTFPNISAPIPKENRSFFSQFWFWITGNERKEWLKITNERSNQLQFTTEELASECKEILRRLEICNKYSSTVKEYSRHERWPNNSNFMERS